MADQPNGNVKQSEFFREMKELRNDITKILVSLEQYHGEVRSAQTDRLSLREAIKKMADWKELTDDRLDVLESRDKRYIANVGGVAAVVSAVVTGLVTLLISVLG